MKISVLKRLIASFSALTLLVATYGSAVLGCGGGANSIVSLTPEPAIEPQSPQKSVVLYINDYLGNAHLITDSQGNVLREESRYPYGLDWRVDGTSATTADYVYTGKEYDEETGLVYFGSRFYAPQMGRWITPDLHFVENPKTILKKPLESNLYAYVRNNPVRWIDSDGEAAGDPYPTQHDAARSAIADINPISMAQNIEYAGFIYEKSKGVYSYTEPFNDGKKDEVDIGPTYFSLKKDIDLTAYYHTHAASDPRYYNEMFSTIDSITGELCDTGVAEMLNLDAYLGTPKERTLYYDHVSDIISVIKGAPLQITEIPDDYSLTIINESSRHENSNSAPNEMLKPF